MSRYKNPVDSVGAYLRSLLVECFEVSECEPAKITVPKLAPRAEYLLCVASRGLIDVDLASGKRLSLNPWSILFVPACDFRAVMPKQDALQIQSKPPRLLLARLGMSGEFSELTGKQNCLHLPNQHSGQPLLNRLICNLIRATRDPNPGHSLIARQLAQIVVIEAIRCHVRETGRDEPAILCGIRDEHLRSSVLAVIHDPGYDWSVELLASQCHMSRSRFAERFRKVTGITPFEFVQTIRIRRAAELLHTKDSSLKRIAAQVGYQSLSAFTQAFKRTWGVTPAEYRSENKPHLSSDDNY